MRATGLIEMGGLPGLYAPLFADARQAIDQGVVPVYVLNRRLDMAKVVPGTFIHYLFATIPGDE